MLPGSRPAVSGNFSKDGSLITAFHDHPPIIPENFLGRLVRDFKLAGHYKTHRRGAVVEWLEQLSYGAGSRRIA